MLIKDAISAYRTVQQKIKEVAQELPPGLFTELTRVAAELRTNRSTEMQSKFIDIMAEAIQLAPSLAAHRQSLTQEDEERAQERINARNEDAAKVLKKVMQNEEMEIGQEAPALPLTEYGLSVMTPYDDHLGY